jgi:hypothetical protein
MLDIPSLAACGWLLMHNPTENVRLPITEWEQSLAFDTAAECETFTARQLKAANLSQHFFSIDRLQVFLLGLVRTGSKRHLPFDYRDSSASQADLIAGIDDGSKADSRSVDQIPSRHIAVGPDGGVELTRGVVSERRDSARSVADARGVAKERIDSVGGVAKARCVVKERIASAGGVEAACGVVTERIASAGGVEKAGGVAKQRLENRLRY